MEFLRVKFLILFITSLMKVQTVKFFEDSFTKEINSKFGSSLENIAIFRLYL